MFWSRTGREARRQRVLGELLELDPNQRQAFVDRAVAAGDVRRGEVEEVLRIAHRLEGLRVMTLDPSSGRTSGHDPVSAADAMPASDRQASDRPARADRVWKARAPRGRAARRRTRDYVAIRVAVDTHTGEPAAEPSRPDISWLRP